jgi:hypothetical protein
VRLLVLGEATDHGGEGVHADTDSACDDSSDEISGALAGGRYGRYGLGRQGDVGSWLRRVRLLG